MMQLQCKCGSTFKRQARRLKNKKLCNKCANAGILKFYRYSTARLKEIIENTDGVDTYHESIDDIKMILWEREDRKIKEMLETLTCNCIED